MTGLLAVAFALASLVAAGAGYTLHRRIDRSGARVVRNEVRIAELRRLHESQLRVLRATRFIEGGVDGGARLVQGVHYGIAAIPFGILEAIPPTRPVTRVVHVTHDLIAGGVYRAISFAVRALGPARTASPKKKETPSGSTASPRIRVERQGSL